MGGHSEITGAVRQPIVSGVMLGIGSPDRIVRSSGAVPGDVVVQIGEAPIEGAAVLAVVVASSVPWPPSGEAVPSISVVEPALAVLSDGKPSLEHAAKALGTSVRTLQRRLKSEGTTFAALLEELRRELASGLVRSKDLAIYEVAYLLGYSEPSTFYRAFRRWHGVSPLEYRRTDDTSPHHVLSP